MVLTASIITLATGIIGLGIFKLLQPSKKLRNGSVLGRIWMSWAIMLVVMTEIPTLYLHFDSELLKQWAIEILITGVLAFSLGLIFFHLHQQFYKLCFQIKQVDWHKATALQSLFKRDAFFKRVTSRADLTAILQAQKVAKAELLSGDLHNIVWQTALFECDYDAERAKDIYLTHRVSQLATFDAQNTQTAKLQISKRAHGLVILVLLVSAANNFHTIYTSKLSVVELDQPSDVQVVKVDAAEALFNQGINLSLTQNYQNAVEVFQQSLRMNPNHAVVWYNLGRAYSKLPSGQQEAIAAYKKAVTINPKFSVAWFELGQLYLAQGLTHDAINAHKALMLADTDKAAELYTQIQNTPKSMPTMRIAKDIKPNYDMAALNIYGATASGQSVKKSRCKIKPVMTNAEIADCK